MPETVIELSDSSPEPTTAASTSSRKRPRTETTKSNTKACTACEGSGRVAKKAKKAKKEVEPSRWPWINSRKPELQFKNTRIEFYNCGGIVFKATGKTIEDRLNKLEKFLEECKGDETCHPSYGTGLY